MLLIATAKGNTKDAAMGAAKIVASRCCKEYCIRNCKEEGPAGVQRVLHKALQRVLQEVLPVGAANGCAKLLRQRALHSLCSIGCCEGSA